MSTTRRGPLYLFHLRASYLSRKSPPVLRRNGSTETSWEDAQKTVLVVPWAALPPPCSFPMCTTIGLQISSATLSSCISCIEGACSEDVCSSLGGFNLVY